MDTTPVRAWAQLERGGIVVRMNPPAGSPEDTAVASCDVLRTDVQLDGAAYPAHFLYFTPSEEDLAVLNAGGVIELGVLGEGFPPVMLRAASAELSGDPHDETDCPCPVAEQGGCKWDGDVLVESDPTCPEVIAELEAEEAGR